MKATELMINDWVSLSEDSNELIPTRVKAINEHGAYLITDYDYYVIEDVEAYPIPLTAEMLEKNGSHKVNTQRWDFGEYESECYVRINPKKGYLYVNGKENHCNIYDAPCVHILQHALRLCGLNELADNWRV